jgi:hypothetical protein
MCQVLILRGQYIGTDLSVVCVIVVARVIFPGRDGIDIYFSPTSDVEGRAYTSTAAAVNTPTK